MEVDALITATSRPKCLKRFLKSIQRHLKHYDTIRWHIHEGVTKGDNSLEQAKEQKKLLDEHKDFFTSVQITDPNVNKADAFMKLKKHANSKYILYFEDDCEYFTDIPLTRLLEVMDKYPVINQLAFNHTRAVGKRRQVPKPNKKMGGTHFHYESRGFDEFETVIAERWHGMGAIGRKSFIIPHGKGKGGRMQHGFNKKLKSTMKDETDEGNPKGLEKNIGAFILMPHYSRHISGDQRHDRIRL